MLPVGAQSSLTGGATPSGDVVLSTDRLNAISIDGRSRARRRRRAAAGTCRTSSRKPADGFRRCRRISAPSPAARWRPARRARRRSSTAPCANGWTASPIVLAGGDVLDVVARRMHRAADGGFAIDTATGDRIIRLPDHFACRTCRSDRRATSSRRAWISIDLFIGSEGTLGVIAERDVPDRAAAGRPVPRARAGAVGGPRDRAGRRAARGRDRDLARRRSARHRHRRHRAHRRALDRRDSRRRRRSQARHLAAVGSGGRAADRSRAVAAPARTNVVAGRARIDRRCRRAPIRRSCASAASSIGTACSTMRRSRCRAIDRAPRRLPSCAKPCRPASIAASRWRSKPIRRSRRPRPT